MSYPLSGLRAWLIQRLSAVYLLLFIVYLLWRWRHGLPTDHAEWLAWLRHPGVSVAWGVFFLLLLLHAWVGLRDVILDYARPLVLRLALLSLSGLSLLACGVWALLVLGGHA